MLQYSVIVSTKDRCEALKALFASVKKYTRNFELFSKIEKSSQGQKKIYSKQFMARIKIKVYSLQGVVLKKRL